MILSDAIVVVVTWMVTRDYHQQDILRGFGRKMTLSSVLYKNGEVALCKTWSSEGLTRSVMLAGAIYFM